MRPSTPGRAGPDSGPVRGAAVAVFDLVMDRLWGHYALSAGVVERSLAPGRDAVVLDVGGGTGGVAARLRARVRSVVVVEPSAALTRRGRDRHPGVRFAVGDGRRLPVRNGSADHVLLIEVLHHVDDADAVIAEALRALGPGGSILIEESEFGGPVGRIRLWLERLFLHGVWPRSRVELLARLATRGLRGEVLEHEGFVVRAVRAEPPPNAHRAFTVC